MGLKRQKRHSTGSNGAGEPLPVGEDVVETAVTSALKSLEEGHILE